MGRQHSWSSYVLFRKFSELRRNAERERVGRLTREELPRPVITLSPHVGPDSTVIHQTRQLMDLT